MQGPAVFIDAEIDDQAQELRKFFKSLGAEISEEKSSKGIEDDLHKIIGVCDVCFKDGTQHTLEEIDAVLNSVVSIIVSIPLERGENLILAFCEKMTRAPDSNLARVCLQSLWRLFSNLEPTSPLRYHVYYHLVQVAKRADQVKEVFSGVDQLKSQFSQCPPSNEQMQKLYRLLHDVLKDTNSELASKVMIELLGTYTAENASYAREDAMKCIVTALADPNTFLLDPLLSLKPVRFLEGELIHDLLSVFVSEKLPSYLQFYKNHKEFVNSQGLNHEQNIKKMRLLSFMQLAESNPEMTFQQLQDELQIGENEVEPFIIEVLKTKLVRARMDQKARKVHISSTMHRTFGRPQWQQLRDLLHAWKANLTLVQENMKSVSEAQIELAHKQ
ncbi:AAEL004347-PA [Aedes aegypti]|uniref:Eukaryotic translation initiation factor 3 subunit M n=1 Tax=Aedes aegypti TaxID=7159 RepID=EIF3M_AEDAE|nr:eukaryotic translation initiation factor 3 subunit M [Aedes aegypti]Q17D30.1 RecName: Full=Eukaryotic translation initiation factor 3 subunit M; Short=eIF3m [Aedes aegypti]EAT44291.1 AAEL004347-PA [Aedes aegypti]